MTIDERSPEQIIVDAVREAEDLQKTVYMEFCPTIVLGLTRAFQIAAVHPSIEIINHPAIEIAREVCHKMVELLWPEGSDVWSAVERQWHGVFHPFSTGTGDPSSITSIDLDDGWEDDSDEAEFYEREALARMALDALSNGEIEEAKEYLRDILEDE